MGRRTTAVAYALLPVHKIVSLQLSCLASIDAPEANCYSCGRRQAGLPWPSRLQSPALPMQLADVARSDAAKKTRREEAAMALMLVDFYRRQFEHFWAQGCRPRLLLSSTPLDRWPLEERKPGVVMVDSRLRYQTPPDSFAPSLDRDVRRRIHASCFETYVRTYFRDWGTQIGWEKSWLDINNQFEASVQHYWNLLKGNAIQVAIFNDLPHLGTSVVLQKLCEAMGIVTVMCHPSPFPNALWMYRHIEDFGLDDIPSDQEPLRFDVVERPAPPSYMRARARFSFASLLGGLSYQASSIALKTISLGFLWNPYSYKKNIFKMKRQYRFFRNQNRLSALYSRFERDKLYIYFPLQLQPEASTDILGGAYADQLLAIEELARSLPEGMLIYVKENPKQTSYMRDPSFYKRLLAIPQVRFISFEVSTFELARHAAAVAAIGGGTAGWEALQMGKPVICFGYSWYRKLPGCFVWEDVQDAVATTIGEFRFRPRSPSAGVSRTLPASLAGRFS